MSDAMTDAIGEGLCPFQTPAAVNTANGNEELDRRDSHSP
jgi:hypothetical protein